MGFKFSKKWTFSQALRGLSQCGDLFLHKNSLTSEPNVSLKRREADDCSMSKQGVTAAVRIQLLENVASPQKFRIPVHDVTLGKTDYAPDYEKSNPNAVESCHDPARWHGRCALMVSVKRGEALLELLLRSPASLCPRRLIV